MPTTTNFGWTTPADTDLVKDGAAAIRTVAGNIDTSLVDLKGGTTGQYLAKNSNTDLDYVWSTLPAAGGLTLISETVASGLSSLSFSSLGSYKQLLLEWQGINHSTSGSNFTIRFNSDSTAGNYQCGGFSAVSATLGISANGNQGAVFTMTDNHPFGSNSDSTNTENYVSGYLIVDNYTSTTKFKSYKGHHSGRSTTVGNWFSGIYSGYYLSQSAITSIDIVRLSGSATFSNRTNSTIRLYGVN